MTELDRRSAIVLAGVGMALAGCTDHKKKALEITTNLPFDPGALFPTGTNPPAGKFPIGKPQGIVFQPAGICVVYIRFEKPEKPDGSSGNPKAGFITIRHAYWPYESNWEQEKPNNLELNKVDDLITDARRMSKQDWKSAGSGKKRREVDFENFIFGSQHRVYFFIDNSDVVFDNRTLFVDSGNIGDTKIAFNLIRFTNHLAFDRKTGTISSDYLRYEKAEDNYAYWNTRLLNSSKYGAAKLLVTDNYFTKPDASSTTGLSPIDTASGNLWYSMNIHVLAKSVDQQGNAIRVPLILDPDTGNGMGNNP